EHAVAVCHCVGAVVWLGDTRGVGAIPQSTTPRGKYRLIGFNAEGGGAGGAAAGSLGWGDERATGDVHRDRGRDPRRRAADREPDADVRPAGHRLRHRRPGWLLPREVGLPGRGPAVRRTWLAPGPREGRPEPAHRRPAGTRPGGRPAPDHHPSPARTPAGGGPGRASWR